jgi:hypothetical protein
MLVLASDKPSQEQSDMLLRAFIDWKIDYEQTDDVSLIGIKVV